MMRTGVVWVGLVFHLGIQTGPAGAQSVADSAWTSGDLVLAERLYRSQLADDATSQRALHRLALIYAWSERLDESLQLFDELVDGGPENVEARLDRARVLSWRDDLDGSAAAYLSILEDHPGHREARLGLARVRSWAGDLDEAERIYGELLVSDPSDARALAGHARMAAWSGDLATAERRWREALSIHPDDASLHAGLGATLRWQGRGRAALVALERAVTLDPTDAEIRREHRLAEIPFASRLGPSVHYEGDSDGNRITTARLDQSIAPGRPVSFAIGGYARTASVAGGPGDGTALGALGEVRWRHAEGWELDVGVGATHNSLAASTARVQWRARLATPGRLPAQAWVRHWRRALDETAALMRNGIEISETALGVRGRLGAFRGDASISVTEFHAEQGNRRHGASLGISRALGAAWSLGAGLRLFGFEEDRDEGYFDPDLYALAELRIAWAHQADRWLIGLSTAPGIQKIGAGSGTVSAALRARGSIGRELGTGRTLTLDAGYSSAGLRSFATGAADYEYFTLGLSLGWAF